MNDQQFSLPTTDVRSEIYSLGVTLYFLLSGVALSAEALQHGPKFSGFPKPLRGLLGKLLHRNPDQRPKDLLVVTEMIRESLGKIERRRALSDRYGIPLRTTVPRPREARPRRLVRAAVVVGVLLLLAAAIAPVVFPDSIGKLVRGSREPKQVGVLVGVPDSSPAASQPGAVAQVPRNTSSTPPAVVSGDVQQAQIASAQPQAAAPTNSPENTAPATPDTSASADTNANSSAQANTEPPPATASRSTSQDREKSVASKSKRTTASRRSAAYSQRGRTRLVRSRVTGITSDGRLILRLPSGRTAIVAPDEEESVPRHRNRVYIDRDQVFGPPPGFGPDSFPDD